MYKHWAIGSCKEEDEYTSENTDRLNLALEKASEYYFNMGVPYITLPLLTELHSILFPHLQAGIRTSSVYAMYKGQVHSYPDHWTLEEQLLATCDMCNRFIMNLKQNNEITLQTLSEATALVAFNILSIHPYADGNGRLTRVVAAYLFFLITDIPKVIKGWTSSLITIRESLLRSQTTFPVITNVTTLQNKIEQANKVPFL